MNFTDLERDYEDEGLDARITAVTSIAGGLDIAFDCDDWRDPGSRLSLTVRCADVAEATVLPAEVRLLNCLSDHPLLWQHTEPHAVLYFSSSPTSAYEVFGHLYAAHRRLFGCWRSLSDYVLVSLSDLQAGHGLLARGPHRALAAYQEAIQPLLRASLVVTFTPSSSTKLLLKFNERFVVCDGVSVLHRIGNT